MTTTTPARPDPAADWKQQGWCCRDCAALAQPRHATSAPVTVWRHVATLVAWLDAANPRTAHEIACRVMKLAEETGEAVAAYLGMTGQNPRKGHCATVADLASELCDVIVTAMIALATVTGTADDAEANLQAHLTAHFARLLARMNPDPGPDEWDCHQCGGVYFGAPPEGGLCLGCEPDTAMDGAA